MICNVVDAKKNRQGLIWHEFVKPDDETESTYFFSVSGGLAWPGDHSPGFHVFLGEAFPGWPKEGEKIQRGVLHLLSEQSYHGESLNEIFNKISDVSTQLHAETVYSNVDGEKFADLSGSYQDYHFENNLRLGYLQQAPYADTFPVGAALVLNWMKSGRLSIPEDTIVFDQLNIFSSDDLGARPEEKYFAINALRLCVGGFHKFRPPNRRRNQRRRRNAMVI